MSAAHEDLAIIIGASTSQLAGDLRSATKMFENFAKSVGHDLPSAKSPGLDMAGIRRDANASRAILKSHADESRAMVASVAGGMGGMLSKAVATGGGIVAAELGIQGLAGAFGMLKDSVVKAADLESTTAAFETMLKSGTKATEMVSEIRKFAASTPFNSEELTQSARGLLAYGVAADQIVPTLRTLGDVSAAFGKDLPMSRMTFLYGTLFSQQRAYTKDLTQFAGAGVPIWDELSKSMGKSVAEIHTMAEEGRIGRDEVTKAFVSMTSAGGQFEGMTAKLADSVHGTWEQMGDAFDLAKIKLGQVIIEGLNLKQMFKSGGNFADELTHGMDRLKPAIAFLGDLARAGANMGIEFARSIPKIGDIIAQQINVAAPEIGAAWNRLRDIVKDAGDFKLDPQKVVAFGVAAGKALLDISIDGLRFIDKASDKFIDGFLNPMLDAIAAIKQLVGEVKVGANGARKFLDVAADPLGAGVKAGQQFREEHRFGFQYPTDEMKPGEILKNYDVLRHKKMEIEDRPLTTGLNARINAAEIGDLNKVMDKFASHFGDAKAARKDLDQGWLPEKTAPQVERRGFSFGGMADSLQSRRGDLDLLGDSMNAKAAHDAKMARYDKAIGDAPKRIAELHARRDAINTFRKGEYSPLMELGGAFGNPLAGLAMSAPHREMIDARESAKQAMQFLPGPLAKPFLPKPVSDVRLMNDFPTHLTELAKNLKAEYQPLNVGPNVHNIDDALRGTKLGIERDDLTKLLEAGKIDKSIFDRVWHDKVAGVAEKMGVGQYQLPDAAMKDTTESVRMLNQWQTGQGQQTTQTLLQQILEQLKRGNENTAKTADLLPNVAPMPTVLGH